jgi:inner membrane protein
MPSLGHVAVGLAAGRFHAGRGRPRLAPTLALTALSMFPDVDVLARSFGAGRGSPLLHRGALHSLPVAALVAIALVLVTGGLGTSRLRAAAIAVAVAASHAILDAFTHGGAGVMFLWPFTAHRFVAPWHLLPAAPMGLRFASARGLDVMLREAVLFAPLLVYAAWPRAAGKLGAERPYPQ